MSGVTTTNEGVWICFYGDRSSVIPFCNELLALRHAVANHMECKFFAYGKEIR